MNGLVGRVFVRKREHRSPGVNSEPMRVRRVMADGMLRMSDGCEWDRDALRSAGWYLKRAPRKRPS